MFEMSNSMKAFLGIFLIGSFASSGATYDDSLGLANAISMITGIALIVACFHDSITKIREGKVAASKWFGIVPLLYLCVSAYKEKSWNVIVAFILAALCTGVVDVFVFGLE